MPTATSSARKLIERIDPHAPSLENRVAYQLEGPLDTVGYRSGNRKDRLALQWLFDAMRRDATSKFLDVGCAFGNFCFMLNSMLGKTPQREFHGVDIYAQSLDYGTNFAENVPGYANCKYHVADITGTLPFPDNYFDAVHFGDVLEHLEDPLHAMLELKRVTKSGGTIVVSTPLKDGLFKKVAQLVNTVSGGRLYKDYYQGKSTELDEENNPIMEVHAGHDHISEMTLPELKALFKKSGLTIEEIKLGSVMSGSGWFDKTPFLLSFVFFLEGLHDLLKFSSWAHAAHIRLRKP